MVTTGCDQVPLEIERAPSSAGHAWRVPRQRGKSSLTQKADGTCPWTTWASIDDQILVVAGTPIVRKEHPSIQQYTEKESDTFSQQLPEFDGVENMRQEAHRD